MHCRICFYIAVGFLAVVLFGCGNSQKIDTSGEWNAVFFHSDTVDSSNHIYYTEDDRISVFDKKSCFCRQTDIYGFQLFVYDDFLYFYCEETRIADSAERTASSYTLYRCPIDILTFDSCERVITFAQPFQYTIADGRIYYECFYQSVKSSSLLGDDIEFWDGNVHLYSNEHTEYTLRKNEGDNGYAVYADDTEVYTFSTDLPIGYKYNDFMYLYENACYYIKDGDLYRGSFADSSETCMLSFEDTASHFGDSSVLAIVEKRIYYRIENTVYCFYSDSGETCEMHAVYDENGHYFFSSIDGNLYQYQKGTYCMLE